MEKTQFPCWSTGGRSGAKFNKFNSAQVFKYWWILRLILQYLKNDATKLNSAPVLQQVLSDENLTLVRVNRIYFSLHYLGSLQPQTFFFLPNLNKFSFMLSLKSVFFYQKPSLNYLYFLKNIPFYFLYIWKCKLLLFQLLYQRFTTSILKDMRIRKWKFEASNQLILKWQYSFL